MTKRKGEVNGGEIDEGQECQSWVSNLGRQETGKRTGDCVCHLERDMIGNAYAIFFRITIPEKTDRQQMKSGSTII